MKTFEHTHYPLKNCFNKVRFIDFQFWLGLFLMTGVNDACGILAGDEFALPRDMPSLRVDPLSTNSQFNSVGALEITAEGSTYFGSAVALSKHWAISAGHNLDFNDDGKSDLNLSIDFHLPSRGVFSASSHLLHPSFAGFGNPTVFHDLSLIYFSDPLPDLYFPSLGLPMDLGDRVQIVGFGRSGYGNYGYTTPAGITDRRIGNNIIDSLEFDISSSEAVLFRYDFDDPSSLDGLGNDLESIIGPGDSGGGAFLEHSTGHALVGINTFTQGTGGTFGDIGGGIVLDSYWTWISQVTDIQSIPESKFISICLGIMALWLAFLRRKC